jgi:putative heme-binding domain-containing protein
MILLPEHRVTHSVIFAVVFMLTSSLICAQDADSQTTLQLGQRLFLANCSGCHGPEGDAVPGTDLAHGKFRRATNDAELAKIIKDGIPGTAMPPHSFAGFAPGVSSAQTQIGAIIFYMHHLAQSALDDSKATGDAQKGKSVFEGKGECLNCHRVSGRGSSVGPDLTEIGAVRRPLELQKSILDPNAEIVPSNRFVRVVYRNGKTLSGRLLNQDAFSVQFVAADQKVMSFWKSDLEEFSFVDKSSMPFYEGKLNAQEVADVVAYLVSLKGNAKQ